MSVKRVIVTINPVTNETSFEVEGIPGSGCTDLTAALTAGKTILQHDKTCEYYETQDRPDYIDQGGSGED